MPAWHDDPLTVAVYEFCFGDGRAIPPSIFLGTRVMPDGQPEWLDGDRVAALEWHVFERSLCVGCRRPRDESFDLAMDDHYDVTELQCHACSARERRAWNTRGDGGAPTFGRYFVVTPEKAETDADVDGT